MSTATPLPFEVPVVDITPYVQDGTAGERGAVARQMDEACRTVGFIQVLGHGIPEAVVDGLQDGLDAFFGLPLAVKKQYRLPAGVNRGYSPPRSESLSLSAGVESATRMNDFFEAFNIGSQAGDFPDLELDGTDYAANVWPEVEGFREQVDTYYGHARRVAETLTRVFADALGVPTDYFGRLTDHSLDVMRMNNYALPEGTVHLDGDLTGMGEHTDYGIVTVLWADQVAGLQVVGPDGAWHDVSPADGALLVNLGDITARFTNDRWISTLHRVKPPIVEGTIKRRRSVAFFHDGNAEALVEAIPTCVPAGEEPKYPPMTVIENIRAKLAGSRQGRINTAASAEAGRILAAAKAGR
jgi:isopenicillin N synthase-like dioxygenase